MNEQELEELITLCKKKRESVRNKHTFSMKDFIESDSVDLDSYENGFRAALAWVESRLCDKINELRGHGKHVNMVKEEWEDD